MGAPPGERDPLRITSRKNPRVRELLRLQTRRGRKKSGRTLLLGEKIVSDAVAAGLALETLILRAEPDSDAWRELPAEEVIALDAALFDELAEVDSPPPWLAVVAVPESAVALPADGPAAVVVACGLQDPGNLGTILRSAWFYGFCGALLTRGTTDPWSPKVLRAAIGAILHRPPEFTEDAEAAIARVTAAGLTPLVLDAHGGRPLGQLALPRRAALILGEEGQGFAGQSLPADTVRVTIEGGLPGRPRDSAAGAESLNVAMAFSAAAWAWRASLDAPGGRPVRHHGAD